MEGQGSGRGGGILNLEHPKEPAGIVPSAGAMKGIHLVLLAVLLCSEHALSLQCYNCTDIQNVSKCQTNTSCETTPSVCYQGSMILTAASGETLTVLPKGCASSCEEASQFLQQTAETNNLSGGVQLKVEHVHCCKEDLCNGVALVGRSLWALAGGLLLSLGPALLWTLL
ncbi:PREDICTED: lymphocyte antigen 6H-like [Ceratotherium simum simum]|uniref:Lymphocyte antigen 6H-like n=1 Tax=Ceratotherium simum simum TaxID=73337 RepID=A0ABM1DLQ7_CERSS|nr:PREDICTED: lymphocyte antigen 6H-like [Ceratotherium simum simum]